MSWECYTKTNPIANKEYNCDASPWLDNLDIDELTEEDNLIISKAKAENFKIFKNVKYIHIRGKYDGEFTTYRARLDINKLCEKYNLFSDI